MVGKRTKRGAHKKIRIKKTRTKTGLTVYINIIYAYINNSCKLYFMHRRNIFFMLLKLSLTNQF